MALSLSCARSSLPRGGDLRQRAFCLLVFVTLLIGLATFGLSPASRAQTQAVVVNANHVNPGLNGAGTPEPTPQSVVSGRIVFDGTERPLRRVKVSLASFGGGSSKYSITDLRGNFRFENVPAGSYFVLVSAPGIVTPVSSPIMSEIRRANGGISEDTLAE